MVTRPREQKAGPFGPSLLNWSHTTWVSASTMRIPSRFLVLLDQYFHLIFWLEVNNDRVFEAIVLEYDRYEPALGARSCHKYLALWQDLKISINYINHVLLVILRHMGTFKNVFKIFIVQIPSLGRTLITPSQRHEWLNGRVWFSSKGWVLTLCHKTEHSQVRKRCHINSKLQIIDKFIIIMLLWDVSYTTK